MADLPQVSESFISLFREVFDGVPFAIYCKDYQSGSDQFLMWNQKAEILWEVESSSVLGRTNHQVFSAAEADIFQHQDLHALRERRVIFAEEQLPSKSEKTIWVKSWRIPLSDDRGTARYVIGILSNISDLKKIESELREQSEKFHLATQLLQRAKLIQQIADELNNPLAICLGRCSQLMHLMNKPEYPKDALKLIESIAENLRVTARSVDELLHVSAGKPGLLGPGGSAGENPMSRAPEVETFVHDLMNLMAISMGKSNQAKKMLALPERESPRAQIQEKITSSIEALKRMEVKIRDFSKAGRS